jgi:HD-GYP domain-containing protein (c-di-GMP phosphodiesterase class II)
MMDNGTIEPAENLNISVKDIIQAYDASLEVWSAALDQRNKEAEGHTHRVMEMASNMAKVLGMSKQELVNIRRGALLHDFGNIAVPESILLKNGELTLEEWLSIHMHPYIAYEMLAPIEFLKPALDIPYRHHEHWDGSGYPRGLKGEEIPLAARLFSVVDVYDSMTSDRPYRPAWSKKEAMNYIQDMAGQHFDPMAVELFFMMNNQVQGMQA